MSDADALTAIWTAIDAQGLRNEVKCLKSIRLATAKEFREFFGCEPEDPRDMWYASFWMNLDDGVKQHLDTILIKLDDCTGEIELEYQM